MIPKRLENYEQRLYRQHEKFGGTLSQKVMMCEIGINWNYAEAEAFYTDFITKAKEVEGCLGVFAWEPQCYGGWEGYHKGMFTDEGRPTSSFNAFKRD